MKGKYLSFLILPSILFAFFLFLSPKNIVSAESGTENDWQDTSVCTPNSCGTTMGQKTQATYKLVWTCPAITFSASHQVVDVDHHYIYASKIEDVAGHWACQNNYTEGWYNGWHYCEKNSNHQRYNFNEKDVWIDTTYKCSAGYEENPGHDNCRKYIDTTYKTETFTVNVLYGKSMDPNHCHKPTPESLDVPSWARGDYGSLANELGSFGIQTVIDQTRTISCDAPVILCEGTCPTTCGYEGGTVPNGDGGLKTCPATNSCSTHRWCFEDEESPTGYKAQAISISITPETGKPWESGKMIDQYCAYTPAGTCPTTCGYAGGDEVADGKGGTLVCEATAACEQPVMCQYNASILASDPLCVADDGDVLGVTDEDTDGDVLGATDVVTADTAGGLDSSAYILQVVLVLITSVLFVAASKEYLKK